MDGLNCLFLPVSYRSLLKPEALTHFQAGQAEHSEQLMQWLKPVPLTHSVTQSVTQSLTHLLCTCLLFLSFTFLWEGGRKEQTFTLSSTCCFLCSLFLTESEGESQSSSPLVQCYWDAACVFAKLLLVLLPTASYLLPLTFLSPLACLLFSTPKDATAARDENKNKTPGVWMWMDIRSDGFAAFDWLLWKEKGTNKRLHLKYSASHFLGLLYVACCDCCESCMSCVLSLSLSLCLLYFLLT